jgi:methylmalonyl-CoA/ethylmalonyl-CoA epimerase
VLLGFYDAFMTSGQSSAETSAPGKQRGVNRVVMAVWDFEAGKQFYERLLGAEFESIDDGGESAAFGVQVAMAWEAGVELVSPLPDTESMLRKEMERNGEGLKGVVFAVDNCDDRMDAAREMGLSHYYFLDYDEADLTKRFGDRYTQYKEYFIAAKAPLSGTILIGDFAG